ncbi:MAG: amidohydrolase family protein [Pseudomonadota bacterium]
MNRITFRRTIIRYCFAFFLFAVVPCALAEDSYQLVLHGGRVIDPETALDAVLNVAIQDGEIVEVSEHSLIGIETIDVTGKIVSPGFIDLHTHSPTPLGQDYQALDGVTTALELEIGAYPLADYGEHIAAKPRLNYGSSVGHFSIRMRVKMGLEISHAANIASPKPIGLLGYWTAIRSFFTTPSEGTRERASDNERASMKTLLEQGLDAGALGIGVGLDYVSEGVDEAELDMLFDLAAVREVPVFIHIRRGVNGDSSGLKEALEQARRSGASVHICHITHNAMRNTSLFLQMIKDAQDSGVDVTTEVLPFNAGSATISAAVFQRDWRTIFDIDYSDVEWAATGERFTESMWKEYQEEYPQGQVIHHYVKEEWTQQAIADPAVIIVSDLLPMESLDKKVAPHNGAFSKILGKYVRDEGLIDLPTAIAKMTLMPAQRLEHFAPAFKKKGRLQVGADADITIFDPHAIQNRATYQDPYQGSAGISHVLVNGEFVVKNGELQENSYPGERLLSATED